MQACVLSISSSIAAREREDESGPLAAEFLDNTGLNVSAMEVIPHDLALIEDRIHNYVDEDYALIVTIGGIGPAPEHVTPEATEAVVHRLAPGIAEALRAGDGEIDVNPEAMLSRGVAGFASRTLVINLPGSPAGVRDSFAVLTPMLGQALQMLRPETPPTEG